MTGSCARGRSPDANLLLTFPNNNMEQKTAIGIRGARKKKDCFLSEFLGSGADVDRSNHMGGGVLPRGQGEERREGQHAVHGNTQGGPCSFSGV